MSLVGRAHQVPGRTLRVGSRDSASALLPPRLLTRGRERVQTAERGRPAGSLMSSVRTSLAGGCTAMGSEHLSGRALSQLCAV